MSEPGNSLGSKMARKITAIPAVTSKSKPIRILQTLSKLHNINLGTSDYDCALLPPQKEAKRTQNVQWRPNLCGSFYKQTSSSFVAITDINIQRVPSVRGRNMWRWGHYTTESKNKSRKEIMFFLSIKICDERHTTNLNKQTSVGLLM
jgi:hypothetical protein